MRFPIINQNLRKSTSVTSTFRGLNQQIVTNDGEWAVLRNVSDEHFPIISSRPNRGTTIKTMTDPKGFTYKNGLFYIDGTAAYYKDRKVFDVTDTDKTIVDIGAYICVFPDDIMFNTFSRTVEHMDATFTQSGTATFAPLSERSAFTKITLAGITNSFKKGDNVEISGCTNAAYNGTHIINDSGSGWIVIAGALNAQFTQASGLKFERKIPEMDFICERDNRLWGCSSKNHEVYCCKIGDPKNWYSYEAGADMAYAATVGSDGDFTACTKFSTYLLFFKENTVHILRGDKPSNFSLTEKELPGVRKGCSRSVQIINETLYYVGLHGVYAFDGSIPRKISDNITDDIDRAVSCQQDGKLYISCLMGGVPKILVYDPMNHVWDVEDEDNFYFAEYADGKLHYINFLKNLTTIYGDLDEEVEWYMETGDKQEGMIDMKYISKIKLNLWLARGSELYVYIKCDDGPMWERKAFIRSMVNKTYTIPIIPKRCSKYRLRIEGKGQAKLLAMSRDIEQGSEINGSISAQHRR